MTPVKRQEERLGALRMFAHLGRILGFIRGRRWLLVVFILLSTLQAVLELSLPLLVKTAIDGHIRPGWVRVDRAAADGVIDEWPAEAVEAVDGRGVYLPRTALSEADRRALKAEGGLDEDGYVRGPDGSFLSAADVARLEPKQARALRADDVRSVYGLAGLYLGLLVLIFGLSFSITYGLNHLGQTAVLRVRQTLWGRLLRLPVRYFDENPVGRLVTRVANDPANLSELFTSVLATALSDVFMFVGILAVFFWLDPVTAGWLLLLSPAIYALTWWFKRVSQRIYRTLRVQVAALNTFIQEAYSGLPVIRSFVHEARAAEHFEGLNRDHYRTQVRLVHVFAVFRPAIDAFSTLAVALVVWLAGGRALSQHLSLGALVAFLLYLKMLFRPLQNLADKFNILQSSVVSSERVLRILDEPEEPGGGQRRRAEQTDPLVRFEDVRFGYEAGQQVLKGVSFELAQGEKVALVGPTGSGKTTILGLLLGFYPLAEGSGRIQVGGRDLADWDLSALRRQFALVQQDLFLFTGSLADNVGLFEPPPPERLRRALAVSRLDQLVERLPDGLDHALNERGTVLSQGERQLVSFARALAHGGPLLVLDEATSSVDSGTEALIQAALEDLLADRTALMVAHRLSTVQSAHRILVLNAGRVVEQGSHTELLAADGLYAHLYHTQLLGAAETETR